MSSCLSWQKHWAESSVDRVVRCAALLMVSPTAMTDCAVPRIDKKAMKASQTAQPTAATTNSTRFWT